MLSPCPQEHPGPSLGWAEGVGKNEGEPGTQRGQREAACRPAPCLLIQATQQVPTRAAGPQDLRETRVAPASREERGAGEEGGGRSSRGEAAPAQLPPEDPRTAALE